MTPTSFLADGSWHFVAVFDIVAGLGLQVVPVQVQALHY